MDIRMRFQRLDIVILLLWDPSTTSRESMIFTERTRRLTLIGSISKILRAQIKISMVLRRSAERDTLYSAGEGAVVVIFGSLKIRPEPINGRLLNTASVILQTLDTKAAREERAVSSGDLFELGLSLTLWF